MGYTKTQRNSYGGWIEKREGGYYLIIMGGYSYRLHFNSRGNVKIAEMHWSFIIVVSYLHSKSCFLSTAGSELFKVNLCLNGY